MVVDDAPEMVEFFDLLFGYLGVRPHGFVDPEEALRVFRADAHAYDILFVNVMMPEMYGYEFVEQARSQRPDLPIVVETGQVWDDALRNRFPPDIVHLPKPFTFDQLKAVVHAIQPRTP